MIDILLPLFFVGVVGLAIIMYVLLDGFDLGIGILFPWMPDKRHRDIMMNSVAPIWDGNETWMVFGGAILYGAFPIAYSTLLPALYMPIMLMLAALIFRGVAFEFRFKATHTLFLWDIAFSAGSTMAAFCQGLILGTFILGHAHGAIDHIGGYYVWFTPFSIMCGIAVIFGYGLLGSTWLIMKTEGELQAEMYQSAKVFLVGVAAFVGIVSLWTPAISPFVYARWFTFPDFIFLAPLPIATAIAIFYLAYSLFHRYERRPFWLSVLLFLCGYVGLIISSWPYIIPHKVTIWQAAAGRSTLLFLLVGTAILLPTLICYNAYAYYVFKGKVKEHHGYHD